MRDVLWFCSCPAVFDFSVTTEPGWARAVSSAPSSWARLGILALAKTRA
jgi:hypothetical protein